MKSGHFYQLQRFLTQVNLFSTQVNRVLSSNHFSKQVINPADFTPLKIWYESNEKLSSSLRQWFHCSQNLSVKSSVLMVCLLKTWLKMRWLDWKKVHLSENPLYMNILQKGRKSCWESWFKKSFCWGKTTNKSNKITNPPKQTYFLRSTSDLLPLDHAFPRKWLPLENKWFSKNRLHCTWKSGEITNAKRGHSFTHCPLWHLNIYKREISVEIHSCSYPTDVVSLCNRMHIGFFKTFLQGYSTHSSSASFHLSNQPPLHQRLARIPEPSRNRIWFWFWSRIWFCLWPNLSLGFGIGFAQCQIWVSVSDLVLVWDYSQSRIWYRFKFVILCTLVYVWY